jgi:quinol monooxygenase YgiN
MGMVVRLRAAPGARANLLDAVNRYADGLADEPGTEAFIVSVDPGDDDVVWLVEWFTDHHAALAHRSADGFARLQHEMTEILADPPALMRFDPLRAHLSTEMLTDVIASGLPDGV